MKNLLVKIFNKFRNIIGKAEIKILFGFLLIISLISPLFLFILDRSLWGIFINNSIILAFILFNSFIRNLFYKIGLYFEYLYIKYIDKILDLEDEEQEELPKYINRIRETSFNLASKKEGALICFEKKYSLDKYTKKSVYLDANITVELIVSLFNKNSPLHDGAVVIKDEKIKYASTYFPITENSTNTLKKTYGSRHRAAVGITERTDSVVILVSEEKGTVHIVSKGNISKSLDRNDFNSLMLKYK